MRVQSMGDDPISDPGAGYASIREVGGDSWIRVWLYATYLQNRRLLTLRFISRDRLRTRELMLSSPQPYACPPTKH